MDIGVPNDYYSFGLFYFSKALCRPAERQVAERLPDGWRGSRVSFLSRQGGTSVMPKADPPVAETRRALPYLKTKAATLPPLLWLPRVTTPLASGVRAKLLEVAEKNLFLKNVRSFFNKTYINILNAVNVAFNFFFQ